MNHPNVKHSTATNEHYTPSHIVEKARALMGGIDLDPASCALANSIVRATDYCSIEDDGLAHPWHGNVFLNPPGGKDAQNRSNQKVWWNKLAEEWTSGRVVSAVFVAFSMELLQTCQVGAPPGGLLPFDFPMVIPSLRIEFLTEVNGELVPGTSPTHGNAIVYLPPFTNMKHYVAFRSAFGDLGRVVMPPPTSFRLRPAPRPVIEWTPELDAHMQRLLEGEKRLAAMAASGRPT